MDTSLMPIRNLVSSLDDLMALAGVLVKSGLLPAAVKTPEAAAAIMLKGRELGIPPMESFAQINVIVGTPTLRPQGMIALARRTHELDDIQISDDGNTCTVRVKRKGQSPFITRFSMEDAKRMMTTEWVNNEKKSIPLADKYNWRQMPAVMRQWRAIAANFRVTFPDVIGGLYTPDEIGSDETETTPVIEVENQDPKEPTYEPIDSGPESPAASIGQRHQAETEAEIHTRVPGSGSEPLGPGVVIPTKQTNGTKLPSLSRVSPAEILAYAREHYPTEDNRLDVIMADAVKGGFKESKITPQTLNAFYESLVIGRQVFLEEAPK